jgi:hypothetical protein
MFWICSLGFCSDEIVLRVYYYSSVEGFVMVDGSNERRFSDDRYDGVIAELVMFISWNRDFGMDRLSLERLCDIARGLCAREGVVFWESDLVGLVHDAEAIDHADGCELRSSTGFDSSFVSVCKSIGMAPLRRFHVRTMPEDERRWECVGHGKLINRISGKVFTNEITWDDWMRCFEFARGQPHIRVFENEIDFRRASRDFLVLHKINIS